MKIILAADHGGFELKEHLKTKLEEWGHTVDDRGVHSGDSVDYPDIARPAAEAIAGGEAEMGLFICGSGIGVSIVANKVKGIRAALCSDPYNAHMSRLHNNANVLCLGGRMIGPDLAAETLKAFIEGEFEGGRHKRRVDKIEG
jgi:ribose 5-phosphate isomerase B